MNVTIHLRILPDLGSTYSLLVNGERLGDMETLNDAIVLLDRLENQDLTIAEAHAILSLERSEDGPSPRDSDRPKALWLQAPKREPQRVSGQGAEAGWSPVAEPVPLAHARRRRVVTAAHFRRP